MEIPNNYYFTDEHEWARENDDGTISIGITDHAQDLLGDVVYIELPLDGDTVEQGADFGIIESVKTASDIYAPVSGTVVEINDELHDAPELVNESPHDEGWMIRVEPDDLSELENLMDASSYESFVGEE
jgi:glycine cleavage system H protein